ncbi:type IX secretion system membrane protein PorP/SprF [Fulvivirgaceae bacterium BMA12]|uniref:Type IX secretion system membrane protein PorP/SprF n=1 Tax=Agaribacillus aureus TaxID=3051825 RepID=A0ABT8KZA3_9BACT|nr:type IX secretion system membrane protein PorP/SprF [Fulvivirgaceae bacterium BMA12]
MKKHFLNLCAHLLWLGLVLWPIQVVFGQEQFQQTQFIYSAFAINPAFSGVEDVINGHTGFKRMWAGLDDAPTNYYAGIQGSISSFKNAMSEKRTLRRSNERFYKKLTNQKNALSHGLGTYLSFHKQGAFNKFSGYLSYALIYGLSDDFKISMGLGTQFTRQKFRQDFIVLNNPDDDDVYLNYLNGAGDMFGMNLNVGAMIYGKNLFFSYAIHQPMKITSNANDNQVIDPGIFHYMIAGYNIIINHSFTLQPSVLLQYNENYELSQHYMAKVKYKNLFWLGSGYRVSDAISAIIGFSSRNGLLFSYAYEYHVENIGYQSNGSHEVTIGMRIFRDNVSQPFLW